MPTLSFVYYLCLHCHLFIIFAYIVICLLSLPTLSFVYYLCLHCHLFIIFAYIVICLLYLPTLSFVYYLCLHYHLFIIFAYIIISLLSLPTLSFIYYLCLHYLEGDVCNTYMNSLKYTSTTLCDNSSFTSFLSWSMYMQKLYTKSGCNPSFKLCIILLLAGDVSINDGPNTSTNLRYVCHKSAALSDLMLSKYILALTETWLSASDTSACLADICPNGFCLCHHPRHSGRGGGVAFLVHETYKVEIIHTPQYHSFDVILCILIKSSIPANFICICRPPANTDIFF